MEKLYLGYLRFQIGCIIAEYDLFKKLYMYEFLYKFDTVLYKFLETRTSDITFMGRDQNLK